MDLKVNNKICKMCEVEKNQFDFTPSLNVCKKCINTKKMKARRRLGSVSKKAIKGTFFVNHRINFNY